MGYLTTITLYNDALHDFEKHPQEFAEAVFNGINQANRENRQVDVGFKGYCNYISIQNSRHADDATVFLHYGNGVTNINPYDSRFLDLMESRPELAQEYLNKAKQILKLAQQKLNEKSKKKE